MRELPIARKVPVAAFALPAWRAVEAFANRTGARVREPLTRCNGAHGTLSAERNSGVRAGSLVASAIRSSKPLSAERNSGVCAG